MAKLKEQAEKAQKCSNLSDVIDAKFTEPVAMVFSKLFIKMGFHPNAVTLCSAVTGIIGGFFFFPKNLWYNLIGIALEILAAIFDASDGQVARLTNKKSILGRILDGIGDGFVYIAIYGGIGSRLMSEYIPFTTVVWGWWIWPVLALVGFVLHTRQAKVADYCRQLHMFFISNKRGNELSRVKECEEELRKYKKFTKDWCKARYYYSYTKGQENMFPKTQELLDAIADGGESEEATVIRERVNEAYSLESNKYVRRTNLLTYNLRSYLLFGLVVLQGVLKLLNVIDDFSFISFILPFIAFVLEPISISIAKRYEKIAENVLKEFYTK